MQSVKWDSRRPASSVIGSTQTIESRNEVRVDEILHIIRRRRVAFLSCLAATIFLSILYSLLQPVRYEGIGRLTVDFGSMDTLGTQVSAIAQATGVDPATKLQTQINVLETDTMAWDVIQRLRLDQSPEATARRYLIGPNECLTPSNTPISSISPECRRTLIDEFHRRLVVQPVSRTEIIEIRYRSRSKDLAAKVVNTLANLYVERSFQTKYQSALRASVWLSGQLDGVKRDAEDAEKKYIAYQKTTGIVGTDETHNILTERLAALNEKLVAAEAERVVRESRYRIAQEGDVETIAQVVPGSSLQAMHNQEIQLKAQFAELTTKYDENYPRVIAVREELSQLEHSIATEVGKERERLQRDYETARGSEELIRKELENQKQEAYNTSEAAIQMALLKRDVDAGNALYEQLVRDLKEAGILAGLRANTVTMIDPASLPVKPVEPLWSRNIAWGVLLGVLAGIALCFLLESVDTTITTLKDVSDFCELPPLGIVPKTVEIGGRDRFAVAQAETTRRPIVHAIEHPQSEVSDAYRNLRTSLMLTNPGAPPKVVLITSALPREGKTTISVNTAVVFAQRRSRVLLVDGDMRRGDLRQFFDGLPKGGLSAALAGEEPKAFYQQHPKLPSLFICPAGPRPPQPADMLDFDRMRQLVESWREEFDAVIIDAPPVIGMSDSVILSTMVDTAVLVVRARQSRRQDVNRASAILHSGHAHVSGVVINDLDANDAGLYGEKASLYGHYFHPGEEVSEGVRS